MPLTSTSTAASRRRCACRPSELGLPLDRPLTVTGGMTFGGGPLNNSVLQAMAKMVQVLRDDPGSVGLVTSISGMITKHGASLWSTRPPEGRFEAADVSAEAAARVERARPRHRLRRHRVDRRLHRCPRPWFADVRRRRRPHFAWRTRRRPRRRRGSRCCNGRRRVVRPRDPGPWQPFRGVTLLAHGSMSSAPARRMASQQRRLITRNISSPRSVAGANIAPSTVINGAWNIA